jgi:hypothetical protein
MRPAACACSPRSPTCPLPRRRSRRGLCWRLTAGRSGCLPSPHITAPSMTTAKARRSTSRSRRRACGARYGRLLLPASRVVAQANGRLVAAARRQPRRRPLPAARVRRGVGAPILTNDQLDYPPPYGRPNCSTACRNAGGSRSESSRSAARPLGGPKARAEASRIRQVIRPEKNAERHTPPEGVIDGVLRLGGVKRARSWSLQAAASMTT